MLHLAYVEGRKFYILRTWSEGRKNMIHTLYCTRGGKVMLHPAYAEGRECYILRTWREENVTSCVREGKGMLHSVHIEGTEMLHLAHAHEERRDKRWGSCTHK